MVSLPMKISSLILNFGKNHGVETFVFGNILLAHVWFLNFLNSDTMDTILEGDPKPFIKDYELMRDKERRQAFFRDIKERVKKQIASDWNNTGIPTLWNAIRPVTVEAIEVEE